MKRRAFIGGGMAAILASRRAPAFCIALRNGMMARLASPTPPSQPYDARVLYVETDGAGSYFNTGVTPTYQTVVHVTCQCISVPRGASTNLISNPLFGAASGTGAATGNLQLVAQTGNSVFKTYMPATTGSFPRYDSDVHAVVLGSGRFEFDGVSFSIGTISNARAFGQFCLGSRGTYALTGSVAGTGFTGSRFYSCKIYTDGVLVFDGIPVRKDGSAYVYDRISGGLCGNAHTSGSVTYGPDVPFDEYVEYLESTGTQYIDTGAVADDDVGMRVSGMVTIGTNDESYPTLAGWNYSDDSKYCICYEGGNAVFVTADSGLHAADASMPDLVGKQIVAEINFKDNDRLALYDITNNTSQSANLTSFSGSPASMMLFCAGDETGGPMYLMDGGRIGRAVVTKGSAVVRDLVSCRIGQTGYMYDRANPTGGPLGNGLYPNLGTGNFMLGPDR